MKAIDFLCPLLVPLLAAATAAQEHEQPPPSQQKLRVPLNDGSARELHVHPIRELVATVLAAQRGIDPEPDDAEGDAVIAVARVLRDSIRTFVEPPLEAGEEVQSLGRDHLAVIGRPAQQAWVLRFLERQRTTVGTVAFLELQVLRLEPAAFAALGFGDEPKVLSTAAGAELARRIQAQCELADSGVEMVQAPKLAVLALQQMTVAAIDQVAYVKDFELREIDGAQIADPQIGVVEDGLELAGNFVVIDDGVLGLSWHVRLSDLERPIPRFETSLGVGAPVSIQIPKVAVAEFDAKVRLAPGELAVLPGPMLRGKRIVLLMGAGVTAVEQGRVK